MKVEIFSFGRVFFATSVVNSGWTSFVVTVAVRSVEEIAGQTAAEIDASSSAMPARSPRPSASAR